MTDQVTPHESLVFRFFSMFARMEYALKRSGFVKEAGHGGAQPDWREFIKTVERRWDGLQDAEFRAARDYLLASPPLRQIVRQRQLDWADLTRGNDQSEASYVIGCVKMVRNNLFHGGKFPIPTASVAPPERDARLLETSVLILRCVVTLDERVQRAFDDDE